MQTGWSATSARGSGLEGEQQHVDCSIAGAPVPFVAMVMDDRVKALLEHFDEGQPSTINSLALHTGLDSRVIRARLLEAHASNLVDLSDDYQRWCLTERGRDVRLQ